MKPFSPPVAQVTRALVVACVLVQLAASLGGPTFNLWLTANFALIPARLVQHVVVPGLLPAPLTLVTSMFLHAGWMHLLLNMLFLTWVGRYVEWVVGRWRFLVLYLLGGLAGGLLQVAVDTASMAPVVGASGAIAAVFGAYAVLFARSRASARTVLGVTISADLLTALWYAAVWIGLQLLTALAFSTGPLQVAIWTHIGGFITGLIFAQPFVRGPRVEPRD